MKTVNVSGLKKNPSEALRQARHDMVVVMNRDKPNALMIGLQSSSLLEMAGVKVALATALFRDGELSLARSARLAEMPIAAFIKHLSQLKIPVIRLNADETVQDMETLDQWRASS